MKKPWRKVLDSFEVATPKSIFIPWHKRGIDWELRLDCGHVEYRPLYRFPKSPKKVRCSNCKSNNHRTGFFCQKCGTVYTKIDEVLRCLTCNP